MAQFTKAFERAQQSDSDSGSDVESGDSDFESEMESDHSDSDDEEVNDSWGNWWRKKGCVLQACPRVYIRCLPGYKRVTRDANGCPICARCEKEEPKKCVTCGHIECAEGEVKVPQTCFRCARCIKEDPPIPKNCPMLRCASPSMMNCPSGQLYVPKDKMGCPRCPICNRLSGLYTVADETQDSESSEFSEGDEDHQVVPSQPFHTPKEKTGLRPIAPVIQQGKKD
eukprot:TRINITY_DN169_c0_g1_i2.p1 TRINITY_DN169_c0_g1~~TRINITY_DN169_c0_g1_i2.p1  ORF type:complete len:226 (-),score=36.88 TRINITY_DN169_c0_g1_i2:1129-1806(-)